MNSNKERYGVNTRWKEKVAGKWAEYDPFFAKEK